MVILTIADWVASSFLCNYGFQVLDSLVWGVCFGWKLEAWFSCELKWDNNVLSDNISIHMSISIMTFWEFYNKFMLFSNTYVKFMYIVYTSTFKYIKYLFIKTNFFIHVLLYYVVHVYVALEGATFNMWHWIVMEYLVN